MTSQGYEGTDRRPLASRQTRWARDAASWLSRRGIRPNAISLFGMAVGCAGGALLTLTGRVAPVPRRIDWLAAAVMIQLRLICNLLDGMVAVATGRASRTGELYNEIPDRVSDPVTLIGAGYALGGLPVLGYLAACLALLTAYVRVMGKAAGAKQEFCGPMAKQQRMFVLTLIAIYCGLAPSSWQPLARSGAGIMAAALGLIIVGSGVTVIRRLKRIARQLEQPRE